MAALCSKRSGPGLPALYPEDRREGYLAKRSGIGSAAQPVFNTAAPPDRMNCWNSDVMQGSTAP
jgi:hypothetical protein